MHACRRRHGAPTPPWDQVVVVRIDRAIVPGNKVFRTATCSGHLMGPSSASCAGGGCDEAEVVSHHGGARGRAGRGPGLARRRRNVRGISLDVWSLASVSSCCSSMKCARNNVGSMDSAFMAASATTAGKISSSANARKSRGSTPARGGRSDSSAASADRSRWRTNHQSAPGGNTESGFEFGRWRSPPSTDVSRPEDGAATRGRLSHATGWDQAAACDI